MTRFCIYDNQSSMTLGTRTSTIISEYHLTLPQPKLLWLAQSPREWRQIYLSSFSGRPLQMRNILPSLSVMLEPECFLDKDIALKLVFHIIGGLIVDNRESLQSLSAKVHVAEGGNEPTSARIRQSELESAIDNFNAVFSKRLCPSNIGSFVVSYLLMALHASIKDIEILVGRKGEQESWEMYQAMKDWPNTPPAREAIWHAGQILRLFKVLDKITSFQVVIIYHAGLVLFAFSALSRIQQQQTVHVGPGLPGLLVNGDSTEEGKRFINEGSAEPMLLVDCRDNDHALISLLNTEAVVKIVSGIILDRACTCEWLSQRTVDGLVKLLTDLGSTVNTCNGDTPSLQWSGLHFESMPWP